MEKFKQRALYRIIMFTVRFWSGLINWIARPQQAYLLQHKETGGVNLPFLAIDYMLKARRLMGS
jgi:hypothetical protein